MAKIGGRVEIPTQAVRRIVRTIGCGGEGSLLFHLEFFFVLESPFFFHLIAS